jgi:hypothetical protein
MRCRGVVGGLVLTAGAIGISIGGISTPASAQPTATLYVSPSGTATSGCTESNPCATIQDAINEATGGTYNGDNVTIDVAAGTYGERDNIGASSLDSLTIAGSGASTTTVNGGDAGSVITVTSGNVTLSGLTVTGGQATEGAGIDDTSTESWTTTIQDDTVTGNSASVEAAGLYVGLGTAVITGSTFTNGSDVSSQGTLAITDSTFSHNGGVTNNGTFTDTGSTYTDDDDGGLFNENGEATLVGDNFTHDDGGSMFGGGGVDNFAGLTDTGSTYSNDSSPSGGGLFNYLSATLTDDSFLHDHATGGIGGGVANAGLLNDSGSTYKDDVAGQGGGIYAEPGMFELAPQTNLTGDTFIDDSATEAGGAIDNRSILTAARSTFANDTADQYGAGIANEASAPATVDNDTFFDDASNGTGGGVFNAGSAELSDTTFSSDSAATGGSAIYNTGATTIADSILSSAGCDDSAGSITDGGYNVESDDSCAFGSTSMVNNSSINLAGRLAANRSSGPKTLAIRTTSSAFEEVPLPACVVTTDERGAPRPGIPGENCDAGAFEFYKSPYVPITLDQGAPTSDSAIAGMAYASQLTVSNPVARAGAIMWTTTSTSPYVTVTSSGAVSAPDTDPPGTYTVSGTEVDGWGDHGSWTFSLTVLSNSLTITTTSLPDGSVGAPYSTGLEARGGNPPYKWSVMSGSLPKGLRLDKTTGMISGTPNKHDSGTYDFTVMVVDTKVEVRHQPPTQNSADRALSIAIS